MGRQAGKVASTMSTSSLAQSNASTGVGQSMTTSRRTLSQHYTPVFTDRNMLDVKDGYVTCESWDDPTPFKHVKVMDRAVQAVPVTSEGEAQTDLKHPKNISVQYVARVFDPAEVTEIWKSPGMQNFLEKAEGM